MDLKTELLNFVNWHNENNPEKYITNSEIGRYLMPKCAEEESIRDAPDGGLSKHAVVVQSEQFTCKHCGTNEKVWSRKNDDWYCKTCGHICRQIAHNVCRLW